MQVFSKKLNNEKEIKDFSNFRRRNGEITASYPVGKIRQHSRKPKKQQLKENMKNGANLPTFWLKSLKKKGSKKLLRFLEQIAKLNLPMKTDIESRMRT